MLIFFFAMLIACGFGIIICVQLTVLAVANIKNGKTFTFNGMAFGLTFIGLVLLNLAYHSSEVQTLFSIVS